MTTDEKKPEKTERLRYSIPQRIARAKRKIDTLQNEIYEANEKIKKLEDEKLALTLRALYNFPRDVFFRVDRTWNDSKVTLTSTRGSVRALIKALGLKKNEPYGSFKLPGNAELFLIGEQATIRDVTVDQVVTLVRQGLMIDTSALMADRDKTAAHLQALNTILDEQVGMMMGDTGRVPHAVRHKRFMEQDLWTTSDGRMYKLQEMEPEHLINCVNFWVEQMETKTDHEAGLVPLVKQWLRKFQDEIARRANLPTEKTNAGTT